MKKGKSASSHVSIIPMGSTIFLLDEMTGEVRKSTAAGIVDVTSFDVKVAVYIEFWKQNELPTRNVAGYEYFEFNGVVINLSTESVVVDDKFLSTLVL